MVMVLDVCRSVLAHETDAEDAFQATFLILTRKGPSIRKAASLASWLHGVASRTALRARADSARRQRHEARAPERSTTTDPDELTWREVRQAVHEELDRLPVPHRAALVLCYLEGKTQDQAAAQLGLAKGTLKGRLERGRALLRARLLRRGLGPEAVPALAAWPAATSMAFLSPLLLVPTAKAATAVAAGGAVASVVSPKVAALTEGMVKAMFFKKLTIGVFLVLVLAGSGTGLTWALRGQPRAEAGGIVGQPASPEKSGADRDRPIHRLLGHQDLVRSVAYAPDGRWVATAAWDGTARIWDAKTGREERRLEYPGTVEYNSFEQVAFSPDNAFLVTLKRVSRDNFVIILWNRRTGEKVSTYPADQGGFAIAPDGRQIAWGSWEAIHLCEFATGKPVRKIPIPSYNGVELPIFSPDGQTLYAKARIPRPPPPRGFTRGGTDPAQVRAWDLVTGKERQTGLEGVWSERPIAISPDGHNLALALHLYNPPSYPISLRETATGGERVQLTGHTGEVFALTFSPDGRTLASGSMDGTVRLWDLPSGKEIGRFGQEVSPFTGHTWVLSVAFSPDGRSLVSGGEDKTASIWDVSRITGRRTPSGERSSADLEADWKDLAGDATVGYAAMGRLVSSSGRAVVFLGKQLQGTGSGDIKKIERLIADLDDDRFQVREQAAKELESLGDRVLPALRKTLAGGPSPEVKNRLVPLLDRLEGARPLAETIREKRAVEVLELMGNVEARRLLDKLAAGPAESWLTKEAKAAAGRLAKRTSVAP